MPRMKCVGTFENVFSHMNKWCSPPIGCTALSITFRNLRLTSSHQAYRDELYTNVVIAVNTDVACNGSPSTAPSVWDVNSDRHCSWRYGRRGISSARGTEIKGVVLVGNR